MIVQKEESNAKFIPPAMNVVTALQDYLNYALSETSGMKALIMDASTIPIVSVLFSMSEIIQKEVYLVQQLSDQSRDTLTHLNALVLVRPTKENMELLRHELAAPKYGHYHLCLARRSDAQTSRTSSTRRRSRTSGSRTSTRSSRA